MQAKLTVDCHTGPCTFCSACDRAYAEGGKVKRANIAFVPNAMPMIR